MTKMLEPMLNEFREEATITRRVLDRVPVERGGYADLFACP